MKTDMVDWPADYSRPDNRAAELAAGIHSSLDSFEIFAKDNPDCAYKEYNDLINAHTRLYELLSAMYRRNRQSEEIDRVDRGR